MPSTRSAKYDALTVRWLRHDEYAEEEHDEVYCDDENGSKYRKDQRESEGIRSCIRKRVGLEKGSHECRLSSHLFARRLRGLISSRTHANLPISLPAEH